VTSPHTKFYRDKINGKIFGICSGIADYTGIDVTVVRVAMVLLTLAGLSFVTIPGYIVAGFIAPAKPAQLYGDREEQRFWQGVRQSPGRTAREVRGRFRDLDRRLAEVERHYVSTNQGLAEEIEKLR